MFQRCTSPFDSHTIAYVSRSEAECFPVRVPVSGSELSAGVFRDRRRTPFCIPESNGSSVTTMTLFLLAQRFGAVSTILRRSEPVRDAGRGSIFLYRCDNPLGRDRENRRAEGKLSEVLYCCEDEGSVIGQGKWSLKCRPDRPEAHKTPL